MRYRYTEEDLREAVRTSYSIAEVCRKLQIKPAGGNYTTLKQKFQHWQIDTQHFRGRGWNIGLKFKPNPPMDLKEILIDGSTYQPYKLKRRLIQEGVFNKHCQHCGLITWQDQPIPLELHHVNGKRMDNRLENLELLCPNCHALTSNYRGKNIRVAR